MGMNNPIVMARFMRAIHTVAPSSCFPQDLTTPQWCGGERVMDGPDKPGHDSQ
jgi:hypothetical protein